MVYPEQYKITKVYVDKYIDIYIDTYMKVFNQLKGVYPKDEQALASAVATTMIALSKAAGMDIPGVVSFDPADVEDNENFKSFAELKAPAAGTGAQTYGQSGGWKKPAYSGGGGGGYQKGTPYNGPKELNGPISEKQLPVIQSLLEDRNPKVKACAEDFMAQVNKGDANELTKQEASEMMDACKAVKYGKK